LGPLKFTKLLGHLLSSLTVNGLPSPFAAGITKTYGGRPPSVCPFVNAALAFTALAQPDAFLTWPNEIVCSILSALRLGVKQVMR
jgi:hypothetical protein